MGCKLTGGLATQEVEEQAKILSSPRSNGQSLGSQSRRQQTRPVLKTSLPRVVGSGWRDPVDTADQRRASIPAPVQSSGGSGSHTGATWPEAAVDRAWGTEATVQHTPWTQLLTWLEAALAICGQVLRSGREVCARFESLSLRRFRPPRRGAEQTGTHVQASGLRGLLGGNALQVICVHRTIKALDGSTG